MKNNQVSAQTLTNLQWRNLVMIEHFCEETKSEIANGSGEIALTGIAFYEISQLNKYFSCNLCLG